jgi:hypothetical protein
VLAYFAIRCLRNLSRCFDQAAACAFRFLRHPSRTNPPRPEAKSGSAAGRGVGSSDTDRDVAASAISVLPLLASSSQKPPAVASSFRACGASVGKPASIAKIAAGLGEGGRTTE